MMSLVQKERHYFVTWSRKDGSRMKDSLDTVFLGVSVLDVSSAYLVVEYAFENSDAADRAVASAARCRTR